MLQVALLAHISPEPSHHSETLHTIQLASRIHRMRRKKKVTLDYSKLGLYFGESFLLVDMAVLITIERYAHAQEIEGNL